MSQTETSMKELLNQLQNSLECRFELDYLSEKNKNPFEWKALIEGLQGSIYEGGYYMVKIDFSSSYPSSRPALCFLNKIFHPHVSESNLQACICPTSNNIISVLETVENMFMDYKMDVSHSYSNKAHELLANNKEDEFIATAKQYVREYAKLEDLDKFYDL